MNDVKEQTAGELLTFYTGSLRGTSGHITRFGTTAATRQHDCTRYIAHNHPTSKFHRTKCTHRPSSSWQQHPSATAGTTIPFRSQVARRCLQCFSTMCNGPTLCHTQFNISTLKALALCLDPLVQYYYLSMMVFKVNLGLSVSRTNMSPRASSCDNSQRTRRSLRDPHQIRPLLPSYIYVNL